MIKTKTYTEVDVIKTQFTVNTLINFLKQLHKVLQFSAKVISEMDSDNTD